MSSKNIEQVDSSIGGGTGVIHCSCPPLAGVGGGHPELVEGLPSGTVENRSLQPLLHAAM